MHPVHPSVGLLRAFDISEMIHVFTHTHNILLGGEIITLRVRIQWWPKTRISLTDQTHAIFTFEAVRLRFSMSLEIQSPAYLPNEVSNTWILLES